MDYTIFAYLNYERLCNKVMNPEKVKIQIELTQNIKTFEQEHIIKLSERAIAFFPV